MKSHSALYIANKFIIIAKEHGEYLTPLKLIKLMYYAYGWYLFYNETDRLFNKKIEAWCYGPVISEVYHAYKKFGTEPIINPEKVNELPLNNDTEKYIEYFLKEILRVYGKETAYTLANSTHIEGTPWHTTYHKRNQRVIPDDLIKEFFELQKSHAATN